MAQFPTSRREVKSRDDTGIGQPRSVVQLPHLIGAFTFEKTHAAAILGRKYRADIANAAPLCAHGFGSDDGCFLCTGQVLRADAPEIAFNHVD